MSVTTKAKPNWSDIRKMTEWGVYPGRIVRELAVYIVHVGWLNRTCPTCHAEPGHFCQTLVAEGEASHERRRPHPARTTAA